MTHPSQDPAQWSADFIEEFDGPELDPGRWLPYYLPQWSSRARTAPRHRMSESTLVLQIDADQAPWSPEFDGQIKTTAIQTGVFSGPVGSSIGQCRFTDGLVVREAQEPRRLYTPHRGYIETRLRAIDHPRAMVALWMIGYEDEPERSGEICMVEIFGRDVGADRALVGMGIHPFHDPTLVDDFSRVPLQIDATDYHVYAVDWSDSRVDFYADHTLVRTVEQSPNYPMQLMLGVYEFPPDGDDEAPADYPFEFVVDYVRGWSRRSEAGAPSTP
ncbi:MAG: glycoside hydrolase family 16 protein [Candidatus Nanopelagicales bacterium]